MCVDNETIELVQGLDRENHRLDSEFRHFIDGLDHLRGIDF